jgi:hypothetical protein
MALGLLLQTSTTGLQAQTNIWGAAAATGQAEGEFAAPFINSTTATPLNDTAWTALSISDGVSSAGAGGNFPGNAYWTRTLTGLSQGAYGTSQTVITSPSQANGSAIFDSDFLDNNGTPGAFGTGPSPAYQNGDLISPKIDLTGFTDSALIVQFYCRWRAFLVNEFLVSLSVDNGLTWTDVNVNTLKYQGTNDNAIDGYAYAPFYNITQGVSNLTNCRVRFKFNGRYYFSIVDDVTIKTVSNPDIAISKPDFSSTSLGGAFTDLKIGNNRQIPLDNIDPTDLKEWVWGMKIENIGPTPILPPTEYRARLTIDFVDEATGALTSGVYLDTMAVTDTLLAGSANDTILVKNLRDLNFINAYGAGTYRVKYWVEFDGSNVLDFNSTNDTTFHEFIITSPSSFNPNYLSKCGIRTQDGKVRYSRAIFPGGGAVLQSFEYGSMFYFPRGMSDSLTIDSVDIRYYASSSYTGVATHNLAVNIHQFIDGSGGSAPDGILDSDGSELLTIGTGVVAINNVSSSTGYGLATVSSFFNQSGLPIASFNDNGFYMVSIYQNPSILNAGGQATFSTADGLFYGADEINYSLNTGLTSTADFIPHAAPVKTVDASGIGDWNWVGFGADVQPSIGIYLRKGTVMTSTESTVWATEGVQLGVYPNPVNDVLNVEVSLDQMMDVTYILTDINGRIISMFVSKQVTSEIQTIHTSSLSSGVYMLTAKTAKGTSTQKFVKQ